MNEHHDLDDCIDPSLSEILRDVAEADGELETRTATEMIGLLAYELPPMEPSAATKAELMAKIHASRPEAPLAPVVPAISPGTTTGSRSRWPLRLAAGLAFAMLAISGWLAVELQSQRQLISDLSDRLGAADTGSVELVSRLDETRNMLSMVTSPGVEICQMKPVDGGPAQENAKAILYVDADHQHWYLSIHGLDPCPTGQTYQLWFLSENGPVSAGIFDVGSDNRMELSSETMPHGTQGVTITIEREGGAAEPTGPRVLFGNEVMAVL